MATQFFYQNATFLKSAAKLEQLPQDSGWEVAFIGRSNAGKSSALNTITGIKGLARTSATPGRTQMINLFTLDDQRRLVDLPGYGYAKAPRVIKERWEQNTNKYLETRQCLRGLVLIMDIRHPLKEIDQELIAWAVKCEVPLHILLTKADKLKSAPARSTFKKVEEALNVYGNRISLQLFSSNDRTGLEEARERLDGWLSS